MTNLIGPAITSNVPAIMSQCGNSTDSTAVSTTIHIYSVSRAKRAFAVSTSLDEFLKSFHLPGSVISLPSAELWCFLPTARALPSAQESRAGARLSRHRGLESLATSRPTPDDLLDCLYASRFENIGNSRRNLTLSIGVSSGIPGAG